MGFSFRKQYRIGAFIPDAYIPSLKLAVQFDGDYWHSMADHLDRDARFDAYASTVGVKVVRVLGSELDQSYDTLRDRIIAIAELPHDRVPTIPKFFVPPSNHRANAQIPLDLDCVRS